MRRRRFIAVAGSAATATAVSGCLGGTGPSEREWETVRSFVEEGTDLLVDARDYFVSWRDEPTSVTVDEFSTIADDLDSVGEEGPLPPQEEVSSWSFDVTRDDETWRVEGEDLDSALVDLTSAMEDSRELSESIAAAGADPEAVSDAEMEEVDRLVEEIPVVVDEVRGLLFGV